MGFRCAPVLPETIGLLLPHEVRHAALHLLTSYHVLDITSQYGEYGYNNDLLFRLMDIFMSKRLTSNNKWMHRLSQVSGPNKTPPAGHESQSESWLRPRSFVVGRDCKERQMFYGKANWEEWKSFQQTPQINQASINHFLKLPFIDWTEEELAFTAQFLFLGGGRLVYRHLLLTPCFLVNNSSQPGAFFVFHLHEWEAFLRNQGTIPAKSRSPSVSQSLFIFPPRYKLHVSRSFQGDEPFFLSSNFP